MVSLRSCSRICHKKSLDSSNRNLLLTRIHKKFSLDERDHLGDLTKNPQRMIIRRFAKLSGGIGFVICYIVPISYVNICNFSPLKDGESRTGRHEPRVLMDRGQGDNADTGDNNRPPSSTNGNSSLRSFWDGGLLA